MDGGGFGKSAQENAEKERIAQKKTDKLEAKKMAINLKLRKMRKDRNSMSSTDKNAAMMLMKVGYVAPGHNAQFASKHRVILGYGCQSLEILNYYLANYLGKFLI